jgi:hypothetical protein
MGANRAINMLGEALHHAGHVLHRIPPRYLDDQRRVGRRCGTALHNVHVTVDPTRRNRHGA